MSSAGVTPGAVVRACVILVVFGLALLYVRAGTGSRREFSLGAAAESADDWESAVLHYRHSVQWHAPGLGKSDGAFAALVRVGDERADAGDVSGALVSYRSARLSVMAVRHLGTPFAADLPDLHTKIATLMAEQSGGGNVDAERYAAELNAYEDRRPNPLLSLAASAGFFGWLAALGMLAWRGFSSEGAVKSKPFLTWLGVSVVCLCIWLASVRFA